MYRYEYLFINVYTRKPLLTCMISLRQPGGRAWRSVKVETGMDSDVARLHFMTEVNNLMRTSTRPPSLPSITRAHKVVAVEGIGDLSPGHLTVREDRRIGDFAGGRVETKIGRFPATQGIVKAEGTCYT